VPDDDPKALLPADYAERDVEEVRRERNADRRIYRRRRRRGRWMDLLAELDPALHAELLELRRLAPMQFKKALNKAGKKHGFYEPYDVFGPRELDPLEDRRAEDEADEGDDTP
jgi:hypothetical protein